MLRVVFISLVFIIYLFIIVIVNSDLRKELKTNYSSHTNEYLQVKNSNRYFNVTDIVIEKDSKVIDVEVSDEYIYVLYFNIEKNSLKLARSTSLNPLSTGDWCIQTLFDNATKNRLELQGNFYDFRLYQGRPCLVFINKSNTSSKNMYQINLAIAKYPQTKSKSDWIFSQLPIDYFDQASCISVASTIDSIIVLTKSASWGVENPRGYSELIANSFNLNNVKWTNHLLLSKKSMSYTGIITYCAEYKNGLMILYSVTDGFENNPKTKYFTLFIPKNDFKSKNRWKTNSLQAFENNSRYINNRIRYQDNFRFDESTEELYCLFENSKKSLFLNKFKFGSGTLVDFTETDLGLSEELIKTKYSTNNLSMLKEHRRILLVNHKPIVSIKVYSSLIQASNELYAAPDNAVIQQDDFFSNYLAQPNSITPFVLDKKVGYVYIQRSSNKLRLAHEVDPIEVPKTKSWFKYDK